VLYITLGLKGFSGAGKRSSLLGPIKSFKEN